MPYTPSKNMEHELSSVVCVNWGKMSEFTLIHKFEGFVPRSMSFNLILKKAAILRYLGYHSSSCDGVSCQTKLQSDIVAYICFKLFFPHWVKVYTDKDWNIYYICIFSLYLILYISRISFKLHFFTKLFVK